MYISPFVCGFVLGNASGMAFLIALLLVLTREVKSKKR
jgi:hypothetical protein